MVAAGVPSTVINATGGDGDVLLLPSPLVLLIAALLFVLMEGIGGTVAFAFDVFLLFDVLSVCYEKSDEKLGNLDLSLYSIFFLTSFLVTRRSS